jgi:hypothetical protein
MAEQKLTEEGKRAVKYYCDENASTFLKERDSYVKAYFEDNDKQPHTSTSTQCSKFWKKAVVRKEIEKTMGKVAYNSYYIRKKYRDLLDTAEREGNLSVMRATLSDMAKTEAMFDTGITEDNSDKTKQQFAKQTEDTLRKLLEEKERRRKALKGMAERDGTDNS